MKISVIMQSYLGEYTGSRSNASQKFIRAVNSFLAQTYKNSEMIIVSDGCEITHRLYHEKFSNYENIKYAYINKTSPSFNDNGKRYYRGFPRHVGRSLVSGEVTCYLDSDDYMIPQYMETLAKYWIPNYDKYTWLLNRSWYDNVKAKYNEIGNDRLTFNNPKDIKEIEIDGLPSLWYPVSLKNNVRVYLTGLITHRSDMSTTWEDSTTTIEDIFLCKRMTKSHVGATFTNPIFVRCHAAGENKIYWEY